MSKLLEVDKLSVHFYTKAGVIRAVDGVSFDIEKKETLGLVGESGCGKSTLGKAVVGLNKVTSGTIKLDGTNIAGLSRAKLRPFRPRVQMVFQDPFGSLNPRLTIGRILEEPLIVHGRGNGRSRRDQVSELLERVGLHADSTGRYPHEFSGGQRQRIGIARAIALKPELIICDEAVSALDVSIQAQIINLLRDLQKETGLSYFFISHDLSVVRHIADHVMVMYLGQVVEVGDRVSLWEQPLHPYTRALIAAIPMSSPAAARKRKLRLIEGEIPSPSRPPSGCRFHTRCPFVQPICTTSVPELKDLGEGRKAACHFVERRWDGSLSAPA